MKKLFAGMLLLFAGCSDQPKIAGSSAGAFDEATEKAAILETIGAETDAFYKRDYKSWKQQFVHAAYAFQGWSRSDGTFAASTGWDAINKRISEHIKNNPVATDAPLQPKVERRNMTVHFFSDSLAYLVWDQYNGDKEGKFFTHSKDQRLMQKLDGKWRIANVTSFWDYKHKIQIDSLPQSL